MLLAPETGSWSLTPAHATGADGGNDFIRAQPCSRDYRHGLGHLVPQGSVMVAPLWPTTKVFLPHPGDFQSLVREAV
jgi:hypothetical protein